MKCVINKTFFLSTIFVILNACSSNDVQPVDAIPLKTLGIVSSSVKGITKSSVSLEYSGLTLLKTIANDTLSGSRASTFVRTTTNYTYANNVINKIVAESLTLSSNIRTVQEYTITKNNNDYGVTFKAENLQIVGITEINANDQLVKNRRVKTITGSTEIVDNSYSRNEYDANGNVTKVFRKNASGDEFLMVVMTYDNNPSPFSKIRWAFSGRTSDGVVAWAESKNNPVSLKKYTTSGSLEDNYTVTYVYDKTNNLPLSSIWTNKLPNSSVTLGTVRYTFGY
jgi:hypothetical protein